ncbi:MAG: PKD domain-containing protein [bacterium JZ-2024 1]
MKKGLYAGLLGFFALMLFACGGEVGNLPPRGSLTAQVISQPSDIAGPVGVKVLFTAQFFDPDGGTVRATLHFGDGQTDIFPATGASLTHIYLTEGSYTPRLVLEDDDGTPPIYIWVNNDSNFRVVVSNRSPVVQIRADRTYGTAPLTVNFDGTGSYDPDGGKIVRYQWDFDCGDPCNFVTDQEGPTASYTYLVDGIYYAALRVTDDEGQSALAVQRILVGQNPPPKAVIRANPVEGYAPLTVSLDGSESFDPDGGVITNYEWDFIYTGTFVPDAIGQTVTFTYNTTQDFERFTVALRVTDDDSPAGQDLETFVITVRRNPPPVASFTATPFSGFAPLEVSFDASGSFDPDGGNLVLYEWDFNFDGTFNTAQTGVTASTVYTVNNNYRVALRVTDDEGLTTTEEKIVFVGQNPPPVAVASCAPTYGISPLNVTCTGAASFDPDETNRIVTFSWDFGDGSPPASGATVSHQFVSSAPTATFNVTLTVTDDEGYTDTETVRITVGGNPPPVAVISAIPTWGNAPLTVSFDGSGSFDPDATNIIISYEWDFTDDGTFDFAGQTASFQYENNGVYTARLRVTDNEGFQDDETIRIFVGVNPPPVAVISVSPVTGFAPLDVTFDAGRSYDPDDGTTPGAGITSYSWDLDNNGTFETTGALVSRTYQGGTHTIWLRLTDAEGNVTLANVVITVIANPDPVAIIVCTPVFGNAPLKVVCHGANSHDPDATNVITNYSWDFGDGSPVASGILVSHTYTAQGIYTVTLTVTDDEGNTDSEEALISVGANPPPVAVATADPTWGIPPLRVTFDGTRSFDPDETNRITAYSWDFDSNVSPGEDSTSATSVWEYLTPGPYVVNLTVFDDEGLTDSVSLTIFVGVNPPPVAVIDVPATVCVAPCTLTFSGGKSFDPDDGTTPGIGITSYDWTLDGGNPRSGSTVVYEFDLRDAGIHIVTLTVTDNDDTVSDGPFTDSESVVVRVLGNPSPVAVISCTPTFGNAPFSFTCSGGNSYDPDATNVIANYAWSAVFASGSGTITPATGTGVLYTASVSADSAGVIEVTLTVTDDEGLADSETININVGANPPPIACIRATPTFGIAPLQVTFDGSCSFDQDGEGTLTYDWSFPRGTPDTSASSSVVVTFTDPGPHTATLTVTDNEGLSDEVSTTIWVNLNPPPVAIIDAEETVCMISGDTNTCRLSFNGTRSYDPDNGTAPSAGISAFEWSVAPSGYTHSGSTATFEFDIADVGAQVVSLTVTDDDAGMPGPRTTTTSVLIRILGNPAPVAVAECRPTYGNAPLKIQCTGAESFDPDATNVITNYSWDFDDGSGTFTGILVSHEYTAAGTYTVTLTVTDDEGNTDEEFVVINVGPNPPPVAVATVTPGFCTAPCDVVLNGSGSYDPDASNLITGYFWTITGPDANCTPASSSSSTFTLHCNSNAAGVYTAELEVTDDEGLTDTVTVAIYVNLNPPPVAVIHAPATSCMIAGVSNTCVLTFLGGDSYDPDEGLPPSPGQGITLYEWDADGDGSFDLTGATITWTYGLSDVGPVPVTLRVTDNESPSAQTDTETIWVTILGNPDPVAAISCTPTFGTAPFSFTCTGADSRDPDATNVITLYNWTIDTSNLVSGSVNPSSGTGILFTATFSDDAEGSIVVNLEVTDDEGNTDTESAIINVGPNPPPVAVATATPGFCTAPCDVVLNGSGSYDPDASNLITGYFWTITGPDANCTPASSSSSTFTLHCNSNAAGVYTAELEVTDDEGLTDTVTVAIYVNLNPPPVAVIHAPATSCMIAGVSNTCVLTFLGGDSYDPDEGLPPSPGQGITLYEWDADGDGSFDLTGATITWTYGLSDVGPVPVTLRVTDNESPSAQTDTETIWVTILGNPDPVAAISCTPTFGTAPFSFTCTGADSRDPDATNVITLYNWTIDTSNLVSGSVNPSSGTGILFTATFSDDAEGSIVVNLEVTDDEGNTDTESAIINVGPNPPPVAVATATPGFCTAPCDVVLNGSGSYDPDASNLITGYSWTITGPDANCTPASSSSSTFTLHCNSNAAGVYNAELTVTDDEGLTDTVTVSVYINVNPPPVAVLSTNITTCTLSGSTPSCTINANASDSYDPDNGTNAGAGISLWEFTCNNGTDSFTSDADGIFTCTYTVAGVYVLTVRVTEDDTSAQTDTASTFITVLSNPPPVAVIESDRTHGNEPLTVAFTGLSSHDPDSTNVITAYSWDFNDTGTGPEDPADCTDVDSTAASPSHTFPEVGTYLVCLTVTDDEGLTNTATLMIIVGGSDIPPVSVFSASPTFGNAPLTVQFDGNASYDPDNANPQTGITCWEWDFNSDQDYADPGEVSGCPNNAQTPSFTYTSPGTFVVTLRVTDDEGSTDTSTAFISVGVNPPPIADLQASPTSCTLSGSSPSCTISLNACASDDPDNPGSNDGIIQFEWDFNSDGDFSDSSGTEFSSPASEGSTGTTCTQSVTYILAGTYVATVRVTDDDTPANTDTATVFLTITSNPPPVAVIEASPTSGNSPLTVTFTCLDSFDPDATNMIVSCSWDFGDGSAPATGFTVVHTYDSSSTPPPPHSYNVVLTVTDDESLTDTTNQIIAVGTNPPPVAVLTASPVFGNAPLTVTFDGCASDDPDNPGSNDGITLWEIDFTSDGTYDFSSSSSCTTTNLYSSPGTFVATLRVTDDDTPANTDTDTVIISVGVNPPPVAKLTASPTEGQLKQLDGDPELELPVTFNACDSDDPDNPGSNDGISLFEWDFNSDGDFSDPSGTEWTGINEGSSGTTCSVGIEYIQAGVYVVTVRVSDDDTPTNTDTATLFITVRSNPRPIAVLEATPTFGNAPLTVTFSAFNSRDPDETNVIVQYDYDFGDSSNCINCGILAVHTYTAAGTYTAILTVTDDEGLTDTERVTISVDANPPPIAVATATPGFCSAPCDIVFDGSGSYDPDDTNVITAYSWNITPASNVTPVSSSSVTFTAHFNDDANGVYDAQLTVTDDEGLTDTVTVSVYINVNPPPVAKITCDFYTFITPATITCDASASYDPDDGTNPGAGIVSYQWDFTCSDYGASVTPTHANLGGDDDGQTECTTLESAGGDFEELPNESGDSEGGKEGAIATFTYKEPGIYQVFLRVVDNEGNEDFEFVTITARDQPPTATIDADPVACPAGPGVPCTFTLRANNSKDPDTETQVAALYEWDFDYPNPVSYNDPFHITNMDFCYKTGTPFVPDATGIEVQFQTFTHGIHIVALRVTDNDDQPWANDPDDDADNGQDNHACAAVSVLVKNPDFPPNVKVDIARDLTAPVAVRNAPYPEGQDNAPAGWDPNDQAIPNDDEFLANPANCANNDPGCVQLAVWIEDPQTPGGTFTIGIDWDDDGDETTQNFEWGLCTLDPGVSGDTASDSNSANTTSCGPHPTLNPDINFNINYAFLGSNGVTYTGPPLHAYTASGRHHIIVLVCDSADPNDPNTNCAEGDKTIEALKLHPAVEINYDVSGCVDFDSGTGGSSTLDSTCVAGISVLWNDPDGPPLGTDCPTCTVEIDCDFGDSNGNGILEWPDHLGNLGDFTADFSSNQAGETDHIESDATCTYTDPTRNTYIVVARFLDDDSPVANIATATTTLVIRSTPPTIEIVHSEDDTIFDPDGGYDNNDDLVGNPATNWFFRVCADDSDDGAYADAYAAGGGGADATTKWIFWNYDALPGGDGNDPVGSPFGYGDDDPVAGAGFDGSASTTNCVDISVPADIYNRQGRYVFHVRVLDDECHLDGVNTDVDCDADNDGIPEPDNPAVNIGVNASDAWLTLIVVDEPPVINCRLDSESVQALGEEYPNINRYTLTCVAQDPDGGNVTLDLNVDFNKGAAEDPADTYNPFGGIALPFNPATDCADDWSGAGAGYPQDWDFTGFINGFTQSWSYEEAGKYCIVVRATDDEGNTEDHILQVNVVDEPPKLEAQVIDTNNPPTGGPPDELDAVAPVNSNWWIRINAEDPDGIYSPGVFDTVRVFCPGIQVGGLDFDSGNVPYPGGNIDIQIDGDPAAGIQPLTVAGQFTCDVSYTDDDSADPDGANTTTIQVTLTVWSSTPTIDVQVWDDDNNDSDPNRPCDRAGAAGPQTQNRYCRDAFADPSLGNRFFSFYVRADDEDGFANSPGTPSINVSCPTIDTDPGAPGVQALNQTVVGPAFTVTSPPPESFTNTERIDLDFDTTVPGIQPATSDHAGQHTCTITYTDDEGDTESIDVTIVILGNTLPTVLIDVRPEATNPPAVFQAAARRRASSGFTERTPASSPYAPETNIFVFRASVFDQDEGQTELDCAYYGGPGCNFTFEWDLNNDGIFETNTGNVPEVSVVYCDGFANGNAPGNNWAATAGNADPGTPATCTNNGTPDQKEIKVGVCVTDDEGQPVTPCNQDNDSNGRSDRLDNALGGYAYQTIALHDTAPWSEIDVDNAGGNDLLVPDNTPVDLFLNGNDPDAPGEDVIYEFECGDGGGPEYGPTANPGGTTISLSLIYGSAPGPEPSCTVSPGSSATGTLTITDQEGNSRTSTVTIAVNDALIGPPAGVEIQIDATANPLLDLNVCFAGPGVPPTAGCPVSASVQWEDSVGAGGVSGSINWGDGSPPTSFAGAFVGGFTGTHTYQLPGVYTVTVNLTDSDGNVSTASTVQVVLDRAPAVDIDIDDAGGPVGSPGPAPDPRDAGVSTLIIPVGSNVTLRADRDAVGTTLDDDTFDFEQHPTASTPIDDNTSHQFNWFCDLNGDGDMLDPGETQSGINLLSVTFGPFSVGGPHRCLLRMGDEERQTNNGNYSDGAYDQPFGLCGAESAPVTCPGSVSQPAGAGWNNDLWSAEAEVYVVVNDQPPSAYILEDGVGSPAGCPDQAATAGCPTPSLDDFSGHLDSSTTYTVDLRAYGVDADATYDGVGNPVSTPPIDRLIDCTDDGIFDSRFADQSTNLFDFTNFCVYSAPGSYNLRVRNITDLNDTDPITGAFGDATVSIVILDIAPSAYIMVDTDTSDPDNDGDAGNLNGVVNGTGEQFSVSLRAHGVDPDVHFGRPGAGDGDYGANTDDSFNRGVTSTWTVSPDGTCTPSPGDTTTCTWTTVGVKTITLSNTDTMGNTAGATIVAVVFEWDPDANLCKDADPVTPGCQIDPSILFGPPPLSIPLFGQASDIDDGGSITDYSWDCNYDGTFDGDSSGASNTFTCTYERCPEPAEFIIAMRATDDEGSTAWSMNSVVCFDKPPSADIDEDIGTAPPAAIDALAKAQNWNNPLWLYVSGGVGAPITLSGMGADEGAGPNNTVYCSWTSTGPAPLTSTTPTTPQACSFAALDQQDFEASVAGFYEVTLTVEDDEDNNPATPGNQSMARYPLVVFDYDPTISIKAAENAEGCPSGDDPNPTELVNGFNGFDSDGNPVTPDAFCFYTDNLSNPDGDPNPVTVSWDFDWSDAPASGGNDDGVLNEADCDGSGGSGATISYTYTSVGQFRVCAIATDSTGNTTFSHLTVEVNDGQSDGKPSDPYVNVNCQETPPVDPVVPLPFPPCPADDPTCVTRAPTLTDLTPAVFACDAFADDPDDRTLGHQDPRGPDLAGSPHQSDEDGNPAGPDIVRYCWYIWKVTNPKMKPFDPHQSPIADCDNQIPPDLDDLNLRTPVLRFTNTGSYYLEVHVFDEGSSDTDNWCDLDVTANTPCVDGNCDTESLSAPETNCAVGSITLFVTEARPACVLEKVDPTYGWPSGQGGFTTEVIGASACLPPGPQNVGFHWSFGDGAFVDDDSPVYFCFFTPELHSNPQQHTYVSPGQFYIRLAVRDEDTQAESICTATVTGTDWPLFP